MIDRSTIGECVEACDSWNPSAGDPDGEFFYIDIASVDRDQKRIVDASTMPRREAPSRARQLVKANDVLVSTVRPNLNAVALVPPDLEGATASTGFTVLRPRAGKVDPNYLFHWVKTPQFVDQMVKQATGASYPAVSDKIVRGASLPLLPISEQRRIAAILDKADALRAKRREAIAKLDQLLQSVFLDMFGDPLINPKGWPKVAFAELIQVKSGNALTAQNMVNGPYAVYGGNGVSGRHCEFMFAEPQIVIGRVGVYCGVVHRTEPRAWVTDNALYVSKLLRPMNLTFLRAILSAANFNQFAGRAAQPLVSGSRIYPVESIVPPRGMQDEFERRAGFVSGLENDLRQGLVELERLFSSLQQRAFSGAL